MPVFREDPELLRAYREGRRDALERVYRHYVRIVERYLRAFARTSRDAALGEGDAIADLLQEVFVRAFSAGARQGYDGLRDFGPYLTTIARNCFLDTVRARGQIGPKDWQELSLALESAPEPPEVSCEPKTFAVLNAYLEALPARLRGVYEQRFVLGKSQEEASAALNLSRRAIRTAENTLRKGLRRALVRAGISLRELGDSAGAADFSTRISPAVVVSRSRS
jgi:RNA polymerase sigma factor (sigma-70 family)